MGFTSWWHWAIVAIVLLILFGSKKLPDAARGLGQSLRIFKSEVKEMQKDDDKDAQATADAAATDPARRELPAGDSTQPATQRDADAKKSA
ncbi:MULTISPECIES: Sec-independent protein translocase subunit TatA [unclassified Gordonia (in: high G+C Gram-positive bacteria)]|uniref:Sec-independent protein translocase subunit TatA n=1 Tax=Gordonia TaxID=2053 RepID=UPI0010F7EA99|nr:MULTISPECIES: Sec-independent protein translocase subunit TatA [unclassified Gordonia (in: high G+C Gram-positive bacteria)]MCZ4536562.1 Sec-independent protein translocase subunit TatA [Gordonia terrae]MDT0223269.1 Sec-independent protein translocase subunit TatA [Gordonia sp. AC31]